MFCVMSYHAQIAAEWTAQLILVVYLALFSMLLLECVY